jgi:tRNA-2-methylthio-N6-dimethylallyladenosine synthase
MRRGHTVSDYLGRIDAIRNARRQMAITSDIIIGFPGETDADFQETVKLVEQVEYDALFLFKYSERPGTPAANLTDDVSRTEKTARFLELESTHRRHQQRIYEGCIGREMKVLVERPSTKSATDVSGHSTCHKVVNFPGATVKPGQVAKVRITEAKINSLYGEVVSAS